MYLGDFNIFKDHLERVRNFFHLFDLLLDLNLMILACDFLGKEDQDEIMEKIENKWKKMSSGPDMTTNKVDIFKYKCRQCDFIDAKD